MGSSRARRLQRSPRRDEVRQAHRYLVELSNTTSGHNRVLHDVEDIDIPSNVPGIYNDVESYVAMAAEAEDRSEEEVLAEQRPNLIRVIPHDGRFRTLKELRVIAENCRDDLDTFIGGFPAAHYLLAVRADLGWSGMEEDYTLGLTLEVIGTDAFGSRSSELRQYADTIKAIVTSTLGESVRVRIDRDGSVHAKGTGGPWGRSLLALALNTSRKAQAQALASANVDAIVLPISDTQLDGIQDRLDQQQAHTRVHNFASLAAEAFEWQFAQAATRLLAVDARVETRPATSTPPQPVPAIVPGLGISTKRPSGKRLTLPRKVKVQGPLTGRPRRGTRVGSGVGHVDVGITLEGSTTPTKLHLPAGFVMISKRSDVQHGLLVQDVIITMPARKTTQWILAMYCANKARHPADASAEFELGPIVDDPALRDLFALVEGKVITNENTALVQDAVWEITDGEGLSMSTRTRLTALPVGQR